MRDDSIFDDELGNTICPLYTHAMLDRSILTRKTRILARHWVLARALTSGANSCVSLNPSSIPNMPTTSNGEQASCGWFPDLTHFSGKGIQNESDGGT